MTESCKTTPRTATDENAKGGGGRSFSSSGVFSRRPASDLRRLSTEKRAPSGKKRDHAIHRWSTASDGSSASRLRTCRLVKQMNDRMWKSRVRYPAVKRK